jgi:hypothetical protein
MTTLVEPAERLLHGELPDLIDAIDAADHALEELRDGRREWTISLVSAPPAPAPPLERYFNRQAPQSTPPAEAPTEPLVVTSKRNFSGVAVAWSDVRERLLAHTWRALRKVVPACQKLADAPDRREELQERIQGALREHDELAERIAVLRREALATPPVRKEMLAVCALFEQHRRSEEDEVFPSALANRDRLAVPAPLPVQVTAEDVTRRLRNSLPPGDVLREAPLPPNGFSRLVGLFRGR